MISILTLLLYPLAIQYERKGLWRLLFLLYVLTGLLDIIANYTEVSLICLKWPAVRKPTVSMRIPELLLNPFWKPIAYQLAKYLNYWSPSHNHIIEIL
jgi:hypothetical protein